MRTTRTALVAGLCALALPASATAGEVTADGTTARFADPAGAADSFSAELDRDAGGWGVSYYSVGAPITPGAGCEQGFVGPLCPFTLAPGLIAIDLGSGDDALEFAVRPVAAGAATRIVLTGGDGDDRIGTVRARATIEGGAGDDLILPDERFAGEVPPGPTPGGVISGGAGVDMVSYEGALDPVQVSLDARADDGRPAEQDLVRRDVENVIGSHFGSDLVGSGARNALSGGGGADRLVGGGGRDRLEGGGDGDQIDALDGAGGDRVDCDVGADTVHADAGDVLTGCEQRVLAPALRGTRLRASGGRIALTLSCPRGAGRCRGSVRLAAGRAVVARGSYAIRPGRRATLRLKARRSARRATAFVAPRGTRPVAGRAVTIRR